MKKLYALVAMAAVSVATAQVNAFNGADFEDWSAFTGSLTSHGLKTYATQGTGRGVNNTSSLYLNGTPTGNDYVFTAHAPNGLPNSIKEITFWVKGSAGKSLSLNVYKLDQTGPSNTHYHVFNVEDLSADKVIAKATSNQYNGTINTAGNWVKVTLDTSTLTDLNISDTSKPFFSLKVGRSSAYNIDIDNIQVVDATMNVYDLKGNKLTQLVRNTIVEDTLVFDAKTNVKIYNTTGQVVKSISVAQGEEVSVSDLPKGMYIVTGTVNNKPVSQKILKK